MALTFPKNNYVVGRGRLYFDKFTAAGVATGERYLGNTPALSMTSAYQNLDHYSSDEGLREKDDSATLQVDRNGSFSCDNITMANVALLFGDGDPLPVGITTSTGTIENFVVQQDRWYQLGSAVNPAGIGVVASVTVSIGVTPVLAPGNWEVDLTKGRIHVLAGSADIDDGDTIIVTYNRTVQSFTFVVDDESQIEGSLRFIADNPKGRNKDYYWPHVKLTPAGEYALKGETWQTMTFNFEVLKPADGVTKRVYVREAA